MRQSAFSDGPRAVTQLVHQKDESYLAKPCRS